MLRDILWTLLDSSRGHIDEVKLKRSIIKMSSKRGFTKEYYKSNMKAVRVSGVPFDMGSKGFDP